MVDVVTTKPGVDVGVSQIVAINDDPNLGCGTLGMVNRSEAPPALLLVPGESR